MMNNYHGWPWFLIGFLGGFTFWVLVIQFFGDDTIPNGCTQSSIVYALDGSHTITYECEAP